MPTPKVCGTNLPIACTRRHKRAELRKIFDLLDTNHSGSIEVRYLHIYIYVCVCVCVYM